MGFTKTVVCNELFSTADTNDTIFNNHTARRLCPRTKRPYRANIAGNVADRHTVFSRRSHSGETLRAAGRYRLESVTPKPRR